jgi:hypothetical protein
MRQVHMRQAMREHMTSQAMGWGPMGRGWGAMGGTSLLGDGDIPTNERDTWHQLAVGLGDQPHTTRLPY